MTIINQARYLQNSQLKSDWIKEQRVKFRTVKER